MTAMADGVEVDRYERQGDEGDSGCSYYSDWLKLLALIVLAAEGLLAAAYRYGDQPSSVSTRCTRRGRSGFLRRRQLLELFK